MLGMGTGLGGCLVMLVALDFWLDKLGWLVGWHTNSFIHPIIPSQFHPNSHYISFSFHFRYGTIHHITSSYRNTIQYNT